MQLYSFSKALVLISFLLLITLSPSIHFIQYITFHDCQRVLQLMLLVFVLVNAITHITVTENLFSINKNIKFGFYVAFVLACISSYFAISTRQAVIEVSMFAALCYLAFFSATCFRKNSELFIKQLVLALLASVLLYMLSFYVGYVTAILSKRILVWPHPFYGFTNIRLFQQYQLWGIGLICLPLLTFQLNQTKRTWLFIALTFWWVLLFHAASRGALVGWMVALFLTSAIYRKTAWPFIRIQLLNATTGLIAFIALFKIIPTFINPINETTISNPGTFLRMTSSGRVDLWQDALEMIYNNPFFGVGPMNYYWNSKLLWGTYPHNTVLQTASEFGLPATLIILGIFGFSLFVWVKRFNATQLQNELSSQRDLTIILFFTVIANGIYALFSGVTVMPISQILMFTIIGLMIGQYVKANQLKPMGKKFSFRPVFALLILVAMTWSTFPELKRGLTSYNRTVGQYERAFSLAPDTIVPRIWMQQNKIMENSNDETK